MQCDDAVIAAVKYLFIARIPVDGIPDFLAYEASVLAVLSEHGGRLEQRFRTSDGCLEVHVLCFSSADAVRSYRSDPRRSALAPLLERSGATTELHPLDEAWQERVP
jgi:hypothetical protein